MSFTSPSLTWLFSSLGMIGGKLWLGLKTYTFAVSTFLIVALLFVSATFTLMTTGDWGAYKTEIGDRLVMSDQKSFELLTVFENNNHLIPQGQSKFNFYLELFLNLWFFIAVFRFVYWILGTSPIAIFSAESNLKTLSWTICIVLLFGFIINYATYEQPQGLSGMEKIKDTVIQLNPAKGFFKFLINTPYIFNQPTDLILKYTDT